MVAASKRQIDRHTMQGEIGYLLGGLWRGGNREDQREREREKERERERERERRQKREKGRSGERQKLSLIRRLKKERTQAGS